MHRFVSFWHSINPVSLLLFPLSLLFCLLAGSRRFLYQQNWISSYRSPVPVVIVGNIYVGGNGKTPLVVHLLESLKKRGYRPGVVSRGYSAVNPELEKGQPVFVDIHREAILFGEEPWMIAARTQVPVVIGRKRSRAIEHLLGKFKCDIIISDDGMQHYAMQRDFEICVIDGINLFGNHLCLPAGPLRERTSRLKEVNLLVYNVSELYDKSQLPIPSYAKKSCYMQVVFQDMLAVNNSQIKKPLSDFRGLTVHAIAGIGRPSRFFQQLKQNGLEVIEHAFDDHYHYQKNDLNFGDNFPILMTEKDAVKCTSFPLENAWYIPITIELTDDITERIIASLGNKLAPVTQAH